MTGKKKPKPTDTRGFFEKLVGKSPAEKRAEEEIVRLDKAADVIKREYDTHKDDCDWCLRVPDCTIAKRLLDKRMNLLLEAAALQEGLTARRRERRSDP